ncbi:unnamed protein product, partial [Oppiella nova]
MRCFHCEYEACDTDPNGNTCDNALLCFSSTVWDQKYGRLSYRKGCLGAGQQHMVCGPKSVKINETHEVFMRSNQQYSAYCC